MALYESLFDGPIDIIGDVHGEITALRFLLYKLGYDESGRHPSGRRLVFLGDLVDRGPDSPGVLEAVMALVKAGRAQCILGNHELNILLCRPMHGNGWIVQPNPKEKPGELSCRQTSLAERERYLAFFQSLPLVLENTSLRIVHACWHQHSVERIKSLSHLPVKTVYEDFHQRYLDRIEHGELAVKIAQEQIQYNKVLFDRKQRPPVLPAIAEKEFLMQMANPVRTLTTSSMKICNRPYFGGGKWRMAERDAWWDEYQNDKPVIIGHFWRQFSRYSDRITGVFGRDLFSDIPPHAWMGPKHNVYCVDYSVGQRYIERKKSESEAYFGKLAALRMPERQVMHDDGTLIDTY